MKDKVQKFLEGNKLFPFSNWKCFELDHSSKDRESVYTKIKKNVGRKTGVYVYEKNGETLYVGKGNPMYSRIKSHFIESCQEVPGDTKYKTWHKFFSKHRGDVRIYWKEMEDEKIRKIIEQMLNYVLRPEFESFRKEYELKEREKEKQQGSSVK